ncbi:helix-turn-helix domain-containing protein [Mesorhizobium tamadayense]|uniref:Helix-turn-helix domain-containing protein n=1 Tax=Mesorhizobium tamadayense TaxID=425306 RepID=A0A3P3EP64_9HYPH|nr:helix-turn-helix domain-containing protein [Mesorhizobium tamadayense]
MRSLPCSRDELVGAAWPDNIHVDARTIDVQISRLRKVLKTVSPNTFIRRASGPAGQGWACIGTPIDRYSVTLRS